jgi:hypothetical protein
MQDSKTMFKISSPAQDRSNAASKAAHKGLETLLSSPRLIPQVRNKGI